MGASRSLRLIRLWWVAKEACTLNPAHQNVGWKLVSYFLVLKYSKAIVKAIKFLSGPSPKLTHEAGFRNKIFRSLVGIKLSFSNTNVEASCRNGFITTIIKAIFHANNILADQQLFFFHHDMFTFL